MKNREGFRLIRELCPALALLALVAGVQPVSAQDSTDQLPQRETAGTREGAACWFCDLRTRPTLTGDWGEYRSRLEELGFTFAGKVTQFGFGIRGGVNTPTPPPPFSPGNAFSYTGRGDYSLRVDLEKLGGLSKGTLLIRAQHWYGDFGNVGLRTGALTPAVFPALLPPAQNDPGVPFLTDFLLTQPFTEWLAVYVGKKNVLAGGVDENIFAGGDGTNQFMNQALIVNPAFLLAVPYSHFTVGVVSPQKWGRLSAFVIDPKDRTQDIFRVDDLFSKGIIVGGEVRVDTDLLHLPGEHHVGAMWKHVELSNLSFSPPPPGGYPYPAPSGDPTLWNSYTVFYGFDQYMQVYEDDPRRRGWGIFGRASLSDGNPTPLRYFLSAGIGGHSPFRSRRNDSFGIGWYYVGTTNQWGDLPRRVFDPSDGTGVELYYNYKVTPWFIVTPDVQYIRPGAQAISNEAWLFGFRVNIIL